MGSRWIEDAAAHMRPECSICKKNLWRVWKLCIITNTTPKPLDLTSNGVKTRITIVSKLRGDVIFYAAIIFVRKLAKYV